MILQRPFFSFAVALAICVRSQHGVSAEVVEGFTEPYLTIQISATEPGVFSQIPVAIGDQVDAHELVAALDTKILEASLAIAEHRATSEATLMLARADLTWQEKSFEQFKILKERGSCSEIEFFQAEAGLEKARANLLEAEEQRRLAELERDRIAAQIESRRICSPIAGIVSSINREVGEAHSAADPEILTIVQLDRLKVKFSVTPTQSYFLKNAKAVSVVFPDNGVRAMGIVQSISPVIDAKSGTLAAIIVLENRNGKLSSGKRCVLDPSDSSQDQT